MENAMLEEIKVIHFEKIMDAELIKHCLNQQCANFAHCFFLSNSPFDKHIYE